MPILESSLPERVSLNRVLYNRSKLLTGFISVQIFVQLLGSLSGIILVRSLAKDQYAWFTIANTMLATMNLLADNGISSSLSSIGGLICQDREEFGSLINTALRFRRLLAPAAIILVFPILIWMLVKNGVPHWEMLGILGGVSVALYFQLPVGVFSAVPRLLLHTTRVQNLDLASAIFRLVLLVAASFVFINTTVAVLVGALAVGLQYFILRRWVFDSVAMAAPPTEAYRAAILAIVKRKAPNTIYFCFQSQASIWLISTFGSARNVADIGALGRLGVIFTIINSVMTGLVMPRFARCHVPHLLWKRYLQIFGCHVLFGGFLVAIAATFPGQLLWILGKQYGNLHKEVALMMANCVIVATNAALYGLNTSRSWIISPWLSIPVGLATQILLLLVLDVSTVRGVLWFGILSTLNGIILNFWMARTSIDRLRRNPDGAALTW